VRRGWPGFRGLSAARAAAAATLQRFAAKVDGVESKRSALLGVIIATGYAYTRRDGIAVIPIGALGA
jgi:hypothetical protein